MKVFPSKLWATSNKRRRVRQGRKMVWGAGLWLLGFAGCDGAEPLSLPPVVSEGADRRGVENFSAMIPQGVAEATLWTGPDMNRWQDLLSVTVFVRGSDDERYALGLQDGTGRVLLDANAPENSPNRALPGWGVAMVQIPVAPSALPLVPPYVLTVKRLGTALPPEALLVRVWTKQARAAGTVPQAQELVIQVINAGGGAAPEALDRALDRARQIWRQGGIEITEAPRTSLDDHIQPEFAHLVVDPARGSDSASVKELFKLSSLALGDGLPLFLVADIALANASGTEGELWALAGGVPVAPVEGTARSGLAVSARLLKEDPMFAGQILAHEIGHALGLFHTTEAPVFNEQAQSTFHDGFADTPACPAAADSNADRRLSSAECHSYDAGNLMFWGTPRGAVTLSPAQADVARRSMLVR